MKAKRRFNYTGRKNIPRDLVEIRLHQAPEGRPPEFSARLDLAPLGLPASAKVIVEAYHKTTAQRYFLGTIGSPETPESAVLTEVDLGGRVLFRVKVVDDSEKFDRLLAYTGRITPVEEGDESNRDYLIKVAARDLGTRVWNIDLHEDPYTKPELQLNYRIPDSINQIRHDPVFQALLIPAIVVEIYCFIFWDCSNDIEDESWQRLWLDFGQGLTGREPPDSGADETEYRDWIEHVTAAFSDRHGLCERVVSALTGET